MMLAVAIQEVTVNVCVQPLQLTQESVIDMVFISNGGRKNFVVNEHAFNNS